MGIGPPSYRGLPRLVGGLSLLVLFPGAVGAGTRGLDLPLLEKSAAAVALGDGGAFLSGVDALGTNPAGISSKKREFRAQYKQFPLSVAVGGVALVWPVSDSSFSLGFSFTSLRSSSLDKRDPQGESLGTFSHQDQMIGFHFSGERHFFDGRFRSGLSIKSIQSRLDTYSGSGLAFDLGATYSPKDGPVTFGATVLNLGQGVQLNNAVSPLPTSYGVSVAWAVWEPLDAMGGVSTRPNDGITSTAVGVQYTVGDRFSLRAGYSLDSGSTVETDALSSLAGGIGVRLGAGTLDYTFEPFVKDVVDAGVLGSHLATFTVRF